MSPTGESFALEGDVAAVRIQVLDTNKDGTLLRITASVPGLGKGSPIDVRVPYERDTFVHFMVSP